MEQEQADSFLYKLARNTNKSKRFELRFDIERSIRYCEYRADFYAAAGNSLFLSQQIGTILIALIYLDDITEVKQGVKLLIVYFSCLAIFLSFMKLFSYKEKFWGEQKRAYSKILVKEQGIISPPDLVALRLEVEGAEPLTLSTLNTICHNEQCIKEGIPEHCVNVPWYKRFTANLWS